MILDAYSLLTLAVGLLELSLGAAILVLAARALRRRRTDPHGVDEGLPLLGHLATVLLAISIVSWPLLYLLLDSYVPHWRGVVCILGVTRIGTGSLGAAGWLPTLLATLQATKPALLLAIGSFAVLRSASRATAGAPRPGRELAVLLVAGAIAVLDAAVGLAYVVIPKRERFLESGCCAVPPRDGAPLTADGLQSLTTAGSDARVLTAAFAAATLAQLLATTWALRRPRWTYGALLAAALSVAVGLVFLREVAAPAFLGLPDHRCAYCVLSSSAAGVAFLVLAATGALCVAWAAVAHGLADRSEPAASHDRRVGRLLRAGRLATSASVVVVGLRLLLA